MVRDDSERQGYLAAVDVHDHFLEAPRFEDDVAAVLERDLALGDPHVHVRDVRLERLPALDPAEDGMVQQGLTGERLQQGVEITGQQSVEERHRHQLGAAPLLQQSLQRPRAEQLRRPRHALSVFPRAAAGTVRDQVGSSVPACSATM